MAFFVEGVAFPNSSGWCLYFRLVDSFLLLKDGDVQVQSIAMEFGERHRDQLPIESLEYNISRGTSKAKEGC